MGSAKILPRLLLCSKSYIRTVLEFPGLLEGGAGSVQQKEVRRSIHQEISKTTVLRVSFCQKFLLLNKLELGQNQGIRDNFYDEVISDY